MPTNIQKMRDLLSLRPRYIHQPSLLLYSLPTEIIELIARELELSDLSFLRLVCKSLSHKTIHYFGLTYFTDVHTSLSFASLEKLQQISQHEQLCHYVRKLLIKGPHGIGRGFSWYRNPSRSLIFPHPAVRIVRESLLALENCRSFCLYNDGQHKYGQRYERGCLRPSDAVTIILHIVAETGLPVKAFAANFITFCETCVDPALLHLESYRTPKFRGAWSQLRELSLRQEVDGHNFEWIKNLIISAPNLQSLTMDFGIEMTNYFFSRVKSCEAFPRLQEVNISGLRFLSESFFDFLFSFKDSLRVLRLSNFLLDAPQSWKSFFPLLKTELPLLETISVYLIKELIWIQKNGIWGQVIEVITFPGFLGTPYATNFESTKLSLHQGWNEVDVSDYHKRSVFRSVPLRPGVSGLDLEKFIITREKYCSVPKSVHGFSYSGTNMSEILDMLAELAFTR